MFIQGNVSPDEIVFVKVTPNNSAPLNKDASLAQANETTPNLEI
jgi:hypothetical protein